MKLGLQIFSWVAIVLGVLALIGGMTEVGTEAAYYSLLGGLLFGVEGVLALLYINSTKVNASR